VIAMQKPTHTRTCSTLEKIIFLYIYMSFKKYTKKEIQYYDW
jgi:hypothetical protein